MSEVSFKDFIKKLQRYPIIYKEDFAPQKNIFHPILSPVKRLNTHTTPHSQPERDEAAGVVKVKLMSGEVLEFPATGTLLSLKNVLKNQLSLLNDSIRILHKGRPLTDNSLELSTLRNEQLNAIVPSSEVNMPFLSSPRFKTDLETLLIRHGLSPHQAEQFSNNFINYAGNNRL
jgi:hypothetical protein